MTIFQIECFIAVAEHRNFSKAARRQYISQPAITKTIKKLEEELGFTLFVRNSRSVELTASGKSFLEDCRQAVKILNGGIERARILSLSKDRVVVRVGTSSPESLDHLATLFREIHDDYPSIIVSIIRVVPEQLGPMLDTGQLDLVIDDLGFFKPSGHVQLIVVGMSPIVALVNSANPLAGKHILTNEDIYGQKIIIPSASSTVDALETSEFSVWLSSLGAAQFIQVDSPEMMFSLVLADEGIAFPPAHLRFFLDEVCQVPLDVKLFSEQVLVYRADNANPEVRVIVNRVREHVSTSMEA